MTEAEKEALKSEVMTLGYQDNLWVAAEDFVAAQREIKRLREALEYIVMSHQLSSVHGSGQILMANTALAALAVR